MPAATNAYRSARFSTRASSIYRAKLKLLLLPLTCTLVQPAGIAAPPANVKAMAPAKTKQAEVDKVVYNAVKMARQYGPQLTKQQFDYIFLVTSNSERKQYPREVRELTEALCRTKYANAQCYCRLAESYFDEMGEADSTSPARAAINKALALDPKCSRAYTLLANLANDDGRFQEAVSFADKAIACPNVDKDAYRYKAAALANLKRYDEALPPINKAIEMLPTHPEYYRIKGSVLENLHRYSEAADCYRKSLSLSYSDWTRFQLVRCLDMQNKVGEAISELNKALAINPRDAEAYRMRAQLKVKSKDLEGALKDYDKTIEQEPTTKSLKERAEVHLKLGHKDLYRRDLAEADKISKSSF